LSQLTKKVENKISFQKKMVRNFFDIENSIINQLIESRKELLDGNNIWKTTGILSEIDSIYFQGKTKGLTGERMGQLFA
jgi:hypothetical protein